MHPIRAPPCVADNFTGAWPSVNNYRHIHFWQSASQKTPQLWWNLNTRGLGSPGLWEAQPLGWPLRTLPPRKVQRLSWEGGESTSPASVRTKHASHHPLSQHSSKPVCMNHLHMLNPYQQNQKNKTEMCSTENEMHAGKKKPRLNRRLTQTTQHTLGGETMGAVCSGSRCPELQLPITRKASSLVPALALLTTAHSHHSEQDKRFPTRWHLQPSHLRERWDACSP